MLAALYARYSTDKQSEASIVDQLRVCERLAERHGFTISARFSDAAISGGTSQRPAYQAMLEAARRGELGVIVAEDTSRLWRNLAEQAPRLAELADLGVHVVTYDLDTRVESAGMLGAVLGASSEAYRREIGRRTRRGLEGRARAQRPTGGRAYGYVSAADSPTDDRAIDERQAETVRWIFDRFADGDSLRAIASDLNARGVPSPGATWNRTERTRDRLWRVSALHTLLQNELYVGRLIWNRARWVRSATDSRKRRYVENPRSEWIVHERPDLAIVDRATFAAAQARFRERAELYRPGPGGRPRYLLSGLLRCAECGGAYVIATHKPVRYGCGTHRQAGPVGCANRLLVAKDVAETKILERIRGRILSPEAIAHAVKVIRQLAKADSAEVSPAPNLGRIDAQIVELERLQAAGVLSAEIAGAGLSQARRERAAAAMPPKRVDLAAFGAEREYVETVDAMREAIESDDMLAARDALKAVLGPIPLHAREGHLYAALDEDRILLVAGSLTGMVAGARFLLQLT